jgi:hypothetical protein
VILCAAYLEDIEPDSPDKSVSVAREILTRLGAKETLMDEVGDLVSSDHAPGADDPIDRRVLHDANVIAKLEEKEKEKPDDKEELTRIMETSLLTESGRALARKRFLGMEES